MLKSSTKKEQLPVHHLQGGPQNVPSRLNDDGIRNHPKSPESFIEFKKTVLQAEKDCSAMRRDRGISCAHSQWWR
jgi:hypothetical protein